MNVTIFNENIHERTEKGVAEIFPSGIHGCLAQLLESAGHTVTCATLEMPEHGLTEQVVNGTDVMLWWGHMGHHLVSDEVVDRVVSRVMEYGMGMIFLHSAHKSKPFSRIVGTSGNLLWGDEQKEIVWTVTPSHPIARGIPEHFVLDKEEMYGEPFMIPQPDELVFASWFKHGNVFRSGCVFYRGLGRVFYLQPGHEYCRSYYNENIRRIILNAVEWAKPGTDISRYPSVCPYFGEKLD